MKVAVGIIKRDNKYLCCQRRASKRLGLQWEVPGGKLEANESSEDALKRELKEELGVAVTNVKLLQNVKHNYDFGLADVDFYFCDVLSYDFILTEHDNMGWFSKKEMQELDFVGSALQIIEILD